MKVNCSEETKSFLSKSYQYDKKENIELKGKGRWILLLLIKRINHLKKLELHLQFFVNDNKSRLILKDTCPPLWFHPLPPIIFF